MISELVNWLIGHLTGPAGPEGLVIRGYFNIFSSKSQLILPQISQSNAAVSSVRFESASLQRLRARELKRFIGLRRSIGSVLNGGYNRIIGFLMAFAV